MGSTLEPLTSLMLYGSRARVVYQIMYSSYSTVFCNGYYDLRIRHLQRYSKSEYSHSAMCSELTQGGHRRHAPLPYAALPHLLTLFSHATPTLPLIQHIFDYLLVRPPLAIVYLVASVSTPLYANGNNLSRITGNSIAEGSSFKAWWRQWRRGNDTFDLNWTP